MTGGFSARLLITARLLLPLVSALCGTSGRAAALDDPLTAPPTAESVVTRMMQRNETRDARLLDYTSVRVYSMVNERFKTRASMKVRIDYRSATGLTYQVLEEKGPGAVRNRVFRRMLDSEKGARKKETRISPENYTFEMVDDVTESGRRFFVLSAEPKTQHPLLFRGKIWVDAEEFAISRIEGSPAKNPSFWLKNTRIVHNFGRVGDGFWMAKTNASESEVRMFGRTEVRIEYGDYKVNESAAAN